MSESQAASAGPPVESVIGFPVATLDADGCVAWALEGIARGERLFVACANPHSLVVAERDAAFAAALLTADMLVPDGVGMVLASRLRRGRIRTRVTGSDFFLGLNARLSKAGPRLRTFFLGSTPETLAAIERQMAARFPAVEVAGCFSPPFRASFTPDDDEAMIAAVRRARADVLWVGMTAPKQETWIARVRSRLDVGLVVAIGAAFDFFAGTVTRSHPAWQRVGLEWLPRLLRQPRRLWRRTFVSAPRFLWLVAANRPVGTQRAGGGRPLDGGKGRAQS